MTSPKPRERYKPPAFVADEDRCKSHTRKMIARSTCTMCLAITPYRIPTDGTPPNIGTPINPRGQDDDE